MLRGAALARARRCPEQHNTGALVAALRLSSGSRKPPASAAWFALYWGAVAQALTGRFTLALARRLA